MLVMRNSDEEEFGFAMHQYAFRRTNGQQPSAMVRPPNPNESGDAIPYDKKRPRVSAGASSIPSRTPYGTTPMLGLTGA
jgi:hypothetical protein